MDKPKTSEIVISFEDASYAYEKLVPYTDTEGGFRNVRWAHLRTYREYKLEEPAIILPWFTQESCGLKDYVQQFEHLPYQCDVYSAHLNIVSQRKLLTNEGLSFAYCSHRYPTVDSNLLRNMKRHEYADIPYFPYYFNERTKTIDRASKQPLGAQVKYLSCFVYVQIQEPTVFSVSFDVKWNLFFNSSK